MAAPRGQRGTDNFKSEPVFKCVERSAAQLFARTDRVASDLLRDSGASRRVEEAAQSQSPAVPAPAPAILRPLMGVRVGLNFVEVKLVGKSPQFLREHTGVCFLAHANPAAAAIPASQYSGQSAQRHRSV
jgi:hypothetical protein